MVRATLCRARATGLKSEIHSSDMCASILVLFFSSQAFKHHPAAHDDGAHVYISDIEHYQKMEEARLRTRGAAAIPRLPGHGAFGRSAVSRLPRAPTSSARPSPPTVWMTASVCSRLASRWSVRATTSRRSSTPAGRSEANHQKQPNATVNVY